MSLSLGSLGSRRDCISEWALLWALSKSLPLEKFQTVPLEAGMLVPLFRRWHSVSAIRLSGHNKVN